MTSWKKQVRAHGVPPGRGSSIQEQTVGDNVGKLPWAAGTGNNRNNLQGLSKRGQKPKEERAQRERRMSLYERRRRSKAAPRNRRIGSRRDVRRGFPTRGALHIMGS